jgi:hypothetical protein
VSTVDSLQAYSKPNTEKLQTGLSDVPAGELTDEVREIMRNNSEALEQMITSKKARVSRSQRTTGS